VGPLILVLYKESYGCAERHTVFDSRLDMYQVLFVTLFEALDITRGHNAIKQIIKHTGVVKLLCPGRRLRNWP
jgi:hypothetical protein